jgi:alpha-tubulin suppressor-like RCC1 family protein
LISDGIVTCWGNGANGELGTGNTNSSDVPVAVTGGALANKTVTQIATGYFHTCALISDGTVTCWGWGAYGELGTGTYNSSNIPVAVTGGALENKTVTQIATGGAHTCALISDGTVTCWGLGTDGQLGTGNTNSSDVPVAVTGGALANKTITQIATGGGHTCALISDGTVTCWGNGADGQLGTGNTNNSNTPVAVTGGALENKTITQIATGGAHTCALISDGTVTCWGWGTDGQLGTGNTNSSDVPVAVTGGALANKTVAQIATGNGHTCALISDGTVTCWGLGADGQLGTGNTNSSNIPVAVTGGALENKTVTQISTSWNHVCALKSEGTVACWGYGGLGQLGTGTNNSSNTPVAITGGALRRKTVTQIATGANHTCALRSEGTVTCWGFNESGQLGTGEITSSLTPVAVTGGALANKTVTQITAGQDHTCALISDGTITCWGYNGVGTLGTGDLIDSNVPVAITGGALTGKTVTQITAGSGHTCALLTDGTVACWGFNYAGGLGTGDLSSVNVPVAITGGALTGETVTQITAGGYHTCALISDGTVSCWGLNNSGQLGTGDLIDSNVPVAITGGAFTGVTISQITAGYQHTCALIADGGIACTGDDSYGQLGTGDNTDSSIPIAVTDGELTGNTVIEITSGNQHTCALISDGTVTCWGNNQFGQLGTGDNLDSNTPAEVRWPTRASATTKPIVLGTPRVGQKLRVNKGRWTGDPTPTFTYKWYACTAKVTRATQSIPGSCRVIKNATRSRFKLSPAQKGKYIAVLVTGVSTNTTATRWLSRTTTAKVS